MALYRIFILAIIISLILYAVYFSIPKTYSNIPLVKCNACHPEQVDEFKRAVIHTSMKCTDCHLPGSFGQDDPHRHNATTLACAACHSTLPVVEDRKPLDHSDFNLVHR